jgi:hypothetical protein
MPEPWFSGTADVGYEPHDVPQLHVVEHPGQQHPDRHRGQDTEPDQPAAANYLDPALPVPVALGELAPCTEERPCPPA